MTSNFYSFHVFRRYGTGIWCLPSSARVPGSNRLSIVERIDYISCILCWPCAAKPCHSHILFLLRSLATCLGQLFFPCRKPARQRTLVISCYTWGEPRWHFGIVAISSNFSEKCVSCLACLTCIDVSWCLLASICSPLEFLSPCGAQISCSAKRVKETRNVNFKSTYFKKNMQSLRVRFVVHQTWWWLSSKSLPKCSN